MGDCDLAIKSPDFLLFFNGESKMTNIGAEWGLSEMRRRREEKEERWGEKDWYKSFFSERNGEKKQNAAESGIHIMDWDVIYIIK